MQRFFFVVIFFSTIILFGCGQQAPTTIYLKPTKVVMLGDSLIYRNDWTLLDTQSQVFFNMGVPGDNTQTVLARIDAVTGVNPDKVFVEMGTNDLGAYPLPYANTISNYEMCVIKLTANPKTKVYLQSVLPTTNLARNASATILNTDIQNIAVKYNCTYIDIATPLTNASGTINAGYVMVDGIHLNRFGYEAWISTLKGLGVI